MLKNHRPDQFTKAKRLKIKLWVGILSWSSWGLHYILIVSLRIFLFNSFLWIWNIAKASIKKINNINEKKKTFKINKPSYQELWEKVTLNDFLFGFIIRSACASTAGLFDRMLYGKFCNRLIDLMAEHYHFPNLIQIRVDRLHWAI